MTLIQQKHNMNEFKKLIQIMARLRDPDIGCPWDKTQTIHSLKEYILEETYELMESIDNKDTSSIKEELGDLLLQIVFISQIMEESGKFSIKDVIKTLNEKLIRRHPHIFGNKSVKNSSEVKNNWERIKKEEKKRDSVLSDYPESMPSLSAAKRYGEQASSVGFDWGDPFLALEKVEEEIIELRQELINEDQQSISSELGDLLFAVANVSRITDVNPEMALRDANKKFKKRFRSVEKEINKSGKQMSSLSLEQMNAVWDKVKEEENSD